MTADERSPTGQRRRAGDSMRIIRNVDNPRQRIAFGTLDAAEAFVAHTADPSSWVIEPAGSSVISPEPIPSANQ